MVFTVHDLISFWCSSWSLILRSACPGIDHDNPPLSAPRLSPPAPRWLRPLCIQRWVSQAIAARLAWLGDHPDAASGYRFGKESEPRWTECSHARYDRRCLRELREDTLRWIFGMEIERLLRIAQASPSLVGGVNWTSAALGVCAHIIQLYAELKRRHKAMQARAIVRAELAAFIAWQCPVAAS